MAEVGNLNTCLGVTLVYFYNDKVRNLLKKYNKSNGYYN